jgi:hypothetical protein
MSTVVASLASEIHRVAIIDDDYIQAQTTGLNVEEANFEPFIIRADSRFERMEDLLTKLLETGSQAVLCDNRLTPQGYAAFNGAGFLALLYDQKVMPSVLITTYVDMDADESIRRWRHKIPVLLDRDSAANPEVLKRGVFESARELRGEVSVERKPYRTLIRVTNVDKETKEPILDVIIPSWNPKRAVRFPLSLIKQDIQVDVQLGTRLFAEVNIGAEDPQELYFKDFELAPESD